MMLAVSASRMSAWLGGGSLDGSTMKNEQEIHITPQPTAIAGWFRYDTQTLRPRDDGSHH